MVEFEAAYARHQPPLFRYLHRLTGDADVAEDIAQECFLRLLGRSVPEDRLRPWLFTVGTNLVRDRARARQRHRRLLEEARRGPAATVEPGAPDPPDEALERTAAVESVREALARLADRDREILLMREEGFRYAEIARAIDVAPSSVGTLLARALRRFEKAYADTAASGAGNGPAAGTQGSER